MYCAECNTKFEIEDQELSFSRDSYCNICARKPRYRHALYGYWAGVMFSAIPFYILILGSSGGVAFLFASILGPIATFMVLYYFVAKLGDGFYQSKRDYDKYKFPKEFLGVVIGFISIMCWFFLAVKFLA